MPWHDMGITMPLLSLADSNVHHHVKPTPLPLLDVLDTLLDEMEHTTRQHERAQ
jgi:hypothetical protein